MKVKTNKISIHWVKETFKIFKSVLKDDDNNIKEVIVDKSASRFYKKSSIYEPG